MQTNGLLNQEATGTDRDENAVQKANKALSELRSEQINMASPINKEQQWTDSFSGNGNGNRSSTKEKTLLKTKTKTSSAGAKKSGRKR
jgi:hypothetical protein